MVRKWVGLSIFSERKLGTSENTRPEWDREKERGSIKSFPALQEE